ncbi:MAG: hypothetical protein NWF00_00455 [Candidatus Bathyarchaeota archaeon]|nr:hypothetical protein [Candidatus Bathyarchaeota archaeon]
MTFPFTFFSVISSLISQANDGLDQAAQASNDQPVAFTIPQIEIQLKCTILHNRGLKIVPSNAAESNYYGDNGESELKLTFKQAPGEKNVR